MSHSDVESRLIASAGEVFDAEPANLSLDQTQADIAGWDSLHHLQLFLRLESEFGIRFSMTEMAELRDLRSIHTALEQRLSATG